MIRITSYELRITDNELRDLPHQHLERVAQFAIYAHGRGWFIAAVYHAMLAARILAKAVRIPIGVVHQATEGVVVFVGDQVTRPFPATRIPCRVAPGRAGQFALAAEKLQVNR